MNGLIPLFKDSCQVFKVFVFFYQINVLENEPSPLSLSKLAGLKSLVLIFNLYVELWYLDLLIGDCTLFYITSFAVSKVRSAVFLMLVDKEK